MRNLDRAREILRQKRGVSLLELIVAMALTMIFVTGTAAVLARGYSVYAKIRGLNEAVQVTELILDKIESQLQWAQDREDGISISADGTEISFYAASGRQVRITAEESEETGKKLLTLHYEALETEETTLPAADWGYEEESYMGFELASLTFEAPSDYPDNIICATVTLEGENGSYTDTRYICCYNLIG